MAILDHCNEVVISNGNFKLPIQRIEEQKQVLLVVTHRLESILEGGGGGGWKHFLRTSKQGTSD